MLGELYKDIKAIERMSSLPGGGPNSFLKVQKDSNFLLVSFAFHTVDYHSTFLLSHFHQR